MDLSKSLWFSFILVRSFLQPTSRGTLSALLLCLPLVIGLLADTTPAEKTLPSIAWHKTVFLDSDSVGQEFRKNTEGWPGSVPHCL